MPSLLARAPNLGACMTPRAGVPCSSLGCDRYVVERTNSRQRNIDGEGRVAVGIRASVRMLAHDAHEAAAGLQGSSATGVRGG